MIYGIVKKRVKRKTKKLEYKNKNCTKRKREIKKSYWKWRKGKNRKGKREDGSYLNI